MLDLGRLTATSVINAHVNVAGLCASCEHVRPCELVVLAERNLAAIGVPPELGRSGDRASSHSPRRPSTLHGAAMWPRAGAQTCRGPDVQGPRATVHLTPTKVFSGAGGR
jgi:hypothetical protein